MLQFIFLFSILFINEINQIFPSKQQLFADARHRRGHDDIPRHGNWNATYIKMRKRINEYISQKVPLSRRNLIIFHVGELYFHRNTMDVATNNVKIFSSSIASHHPETAADKAFYLFNIIHGADNPLARYVPTAHPSVGCIEWNHAKDVLDLHLRTIRMLGGELISHFSGVFFFSQDVRGPLISSHHGQWIREYRQLLDANNVGMVGPTLSCENTPHVQTHAFALRTDVIPKLFDVENGFIESGMMLSEFVREKGYNVSSLLYSRRYQQHYFNGQCAPAIGSVMQPTLNPISWCNIQPKEVIFMDWGGEPVRLLGYLCEIAVTMMRETLAHYHELNPDLELIVPETLVGGHLYEMYKENSEEMYKDRLNVRPPPPAASFHDIECHSAVFKLLKTGSSNEDHSEQQPLLCSTKDAKYSSNPQHRRSKYSESSKGSSKKSKVLRKTDVIANDYSDFQKQKEERETELCFLVRTAFIHDSAEKIKSRNMFEEEDLEDNVRSLLRQTNPHWLAYFFITDDHEFDERLVEILEQYHDPRLRYIDTRPDLRLKFDVRDAGYTPTDWVMDVILKNDRCRWISVTNADNVYGSDIVNRVLRVGPMPITHKLPDMVLNPLDSRYFAHADYLERRDLTKGMGVEQTWTDYCTGLEASLLFNSYTYTIQPKPYLGQVDLASVFMLREKFSKENIRFGNFSDPHKYPCAGCQDGYLTEYLVRRRRWIYYRLSLDGLKSIVYHGPSPTLCIAKGNVWLDYPHVNGVGCLSQSTVRTLAAHNSKYYDWIHLNYKDNKVCLRLSKFGFYNETHD